MQVVVDNLLINYEQIGHGKKVLLIHGWGDDHHNLLNTFQNLGQGYQLVALDLPGFGQSQIPGLEFNTLSFAKIVDGFIKKINFDPEIIIAHSFGGAIAVSGLAKNIISAKKLILIASAGIREYKTKQKTFIKLISKTSKLILTPLPKRMKRKLTQKAYARIGSDLYLKEDLMPIFKTILKEDISSLAKTLTLPVLLIYGQNDQDTPVIFGMKLHELISNSTLEIIGNAGHFVFIDQKEKVLKLVKDFINA